MKKRNNHAKQLEQVNKIIAVSEKTAQSIKDVYPQYANKVEIIYNGYPFEKIKALATEKIDINIPEGSIAVIGRIEAMKDSLRVIEVLKQLHEQGYRNHLYFIGTGELEEHAKQLVKDYNLENYCHFLGYQKNPYAYLNHMSVLLTLSKQEGFSGVCVESLALGVPFVSTDVGGAKELAQNDNFGKIVYNDSEAVQSLIQYCQKQPKEYQQDMTAFIQNFSIEKQIQAVKHLFEQ